jgi:hypothetical protein
MGCLHDCLDLLHVVDVEGRNAVAMFGGMIQQRPHCNESHRLPPEVLT